MSQAEYIMLSEYRVSDLGNLKPHQIIAFVETCSERVRSAILYAYQNS